MTDQEDEVREIMASYMKGVVKLREIVPSFNWSNLLGDYGEYVCVNHYGLLLEKAGNKGFDATDASGKKVQIKTVSITRRKNQANIKLSSKNADHLLVIEVGEDANWNEVYYGPFDKIWRSSYKAPEDQKTISVGRLKKIQLKTHKPNEKVAVNLENGNQIVKETRQEMRAYLIKLGRKVSGMSTINKRIQYQGWSIDQAFGTRVPPNYERVESFVKDQGYLWFPEKPTSSKGRTPIVSDSEKLVYISQGHFAEKHEIPEDYISDRISEGMDAANIIIRYKNAKYEN
jgi:hypothetical protein